MKRLIYIACGWLFVVIGVIGIVTPLLPSTPFLLLAAGFFARSSDHFHQWLLTHPKLGQPILDWQKNGVISTKAKLLATVLIVSNAVFPLFIVKNMIVALKLAVGVVMTGVLVFIWSRPSQGKAESSEEK